MQSSHKILGTLPESLRTPLIKCYNEILSNFVEHRWEPSELNGGKFCEIVYSILNGYLNGSFPQNPSKPSSMVDACKNLERLPANLTIPGDRSARILIPRALPFLYEIRNNRGVGHIGGDVDPNFMDAMSVCNISSWILSELVRIFHNVTTVEAQEMVDTLIERKHTLVWDTGNSKRVLNSKMKISDQVLTLLYAKPSWVKVLDLYKWTEYSNIAVFKSKILIPLHKARMIEYDKIENVARISPLGVVEVETKNKTPNVKP